MDKVHTTSETCISLLRNIDHLDYLDLTNACFYLSLILISFTMEGELLLVQNSVSEITSQQKYETDTKSELKKTLKTHLLKSYYIY